MGWKKWRRRISRVLRPAVAISTFGASEAAHRGLLGSKAQAKVKEAEAKASAVAAKSALDLKKAGQAAGKAGMAITKNMYTGKFISDPKEALSESAAPILENVMKNKMEGEVLPDAPPELKESAADRAERERREFLQKKRGAEKGGRGFGRTILTQRSGSQPTLLGGL